MREFIYFSKNARTSGNFRDLMEAGRLDIVCHAIIMSFFVSNAVRENVRLHLFFYGQPDPPKHIEINSNASISKKDISGLIKRALYKYKKGKKIEALQGCFIEKKRFSDFIEELSKEGRMIYLLDRKGQDVRDADIKKDSVFILGDHEGIPKEELKKIKHNVEKISLGNAEYFASQTLAILQNELDRRNIN